MESPIPASHPSTCRKAKSRAVAAFLSVVILVSFFSGCGPKVTYPASKVPESIEKLCLRDYELAVQARVVGKTIGALLIVDNLIDKEGQIPREINDQMGKVMQVVTRVALSTDLSLDYCVVVIRDRKNPYQLTITRSVDDTKRAYADVIGVEESINRTLFGQDKYESAGSPQAFVLEDVKQEIFLTEQIVQRIRFHYTKDVKDELEKALVMVDGNFDTSNGEKVFRFSLIALRSDDPNTMMLDILKIINQVLYGYRYTEFGSIEIQDYLNRQKLVIDKNTLLDYQQKKIKDTEILDRFLSESEPIQEAFKLFGFALPQEGEAQETAVAKPVP